MPQHSRSKAIAGLLGLAFVGLPVLGCGAAKPIIRQSEATDDRPALPQITVERLQECVKDYGDQLESGSWAFSPKLQVDQDGYVVDAYAGAVPNSAPELAACVRMALRDMSVPSWIFNVQQSPAIAHSNEPTMAQRAMLGSPAVVVVVVVEVALAELVLEAGAFTVLFAATVQVVDTAAKDVTELARRRRKKDRCTDHYEKCVASDLWKKYGRHEWDSLCSLCSSVCFQNNGDWPSKVAGKDCTYDPN